MDLNAKMEIGHVVYIRKGGAVVDAINVHAPEINCDYTGPFDDAQISDADEEAMGESVKSQGWTLETGWTGQYLYSGAIMHPSEFIGGKLAEHIRETPGLWVALSVELHPEDENAESESAGWVLAYREAVHYGYSRTACGDLPESEDGGCTTTVKEVTCPVCWEVIHRPV
ncbi:hypothetical protein [Streptomyces luteogriseus]|uniref:hypothetical protein n=1 Tax=Streptomyces luteogriseus TaxID=68233 RepID=UPI0037A1ABC2